MRNSTFIKLCVFSFTLFFVNKGMNAQVAPDSVEMGGGYLNDVFYNIETGETTEVSRTNWDIAFTTVTFESNIMINDGAGVRLYAYPTADTLFWDAVDTAGLSTWTPLFNDDKDWDNGAFSRNAKGHPDYGWGIYDDVSHNVVGDSLFIIKTKDGDWKKLWIKKLVSVAVTYEFVYANLDGSDEQNIELVAADYPDKYYIYFDLTTNLAVDREPAKADWNLLFTRWVASEYLPFEQAVAGVFQNKNTEVSDLWNFGVFGDDCYYALDYVNDKNTIGWDWKSFNMSTFAYDMVDSLFFVVKTTNDVTYKLGFNAFDYSIAHFDFQKELIANITVPEAPTSPVVDDVEKTFGWTLVTEYPNVEDYEFKTVIDDSWAVCTANPQPLVAHNYVAGDVMVRVKADQATCRPYGFSLSNDLPYTGIGELAKNNIQFTAYPNPASDVINIRLNDINISTVELYNLIGELVYHAEVSNEMNHTISTDGLANGTYMLKVSASNKTGNKLIVVSN